MCCWLKHAVARRLSELVSNGTLTHIPSHFLLRKLSRVSAALGYERTPKGGSKAAGWLIAARHQLPSLPVRVCSKPSDSALALPGARPPS